MDICVTYIAFSLKYKILKINLLLLNYDFLTKQQIRRKTINQVVKTDKTAQFNLDLELIIT